MKTLVMRTTVLSTAVVLFASVALAAPTAKAPTAKKMTDQKLDNVVAGWVNPGGQPCPSAWDCGNNGWGNGFDEINPGSDEGATALSKTFNNTAAWGEYPKINTNPTTSDGR
jgi:hypothetical protein